MHARWTSVPVAVVAILAAASLAGAYEPAMDVTHQHDGHASPVVDVDHDPATGAVWTISEDGGVIGYDPGTQSVVAERGFERGHAVAVGDGAVHVAAMDSLWTYDLDEEAWSELGTLEDHAGAMVYDEARDALWVAGGQTVHGYDAGDGSIVAAHEEHTDGLSAVAVHGDLVASATTWEDEVIVYDVEQDTVAHEPGLPEDVTQVGSLAFTSSGDLLVGTDAEDGSWVGMLDVEAGSTVAEHRTHAFVVSEVIFHQEMEVLVSTGFDNAIRFFGIGTDELAAEHDHGETIHAASLDEDRDRLWIGDGEEGSGGVLTAYDVSDVSSSEDGGEEPPPDSGGGPDDGATDDGSTDGEDTDSGDEAPLGAAGTVLGLVVAVLALAGARQRT